MNSRQTYFLSTMFLVIIWFSMTFLARKTDLLFFHSLFLMVIIVLTITIDQIILMPMERRIGRSEGELKVLRAMERGKKK